MNIYAGLSRPKDAPTLTLRNDPIQGYEYTSKDFAEHEWQKVWRRTWHIGGLAYHVPNVGDYITTDLGRESIIMVREDEQTVRAYYNVCQHRGAMLTLAEEGHTKEFVCPYHGWRYALDGTLVDLPDPEDVVGGDPCGKIKLAEIKCEVFAGFVWFNMDDNCKPLRDALQPHTAALERLNIQNMTRVLARTAETPCNWKILADNFCETYHVNVIHPGLMDYVETDYRECQINLFPNGNMQNHVPGARPSKKSPREKPYGAMADILRFWELDPADYEGFENRDKMRLDIQRQKRLLGPARGYHQFDGLEDFELTDFTLHFVFPNTSFITLQGDGVDILRPRPHPHDPNLCYFDHWYLVPEVKGRTHVPSPALGPDLPFEDAEYEHFKLGERSLGISADEDTSIAQFQQRSMHSHGFRQSILTEQECRVQHLHETIRRMMAED